MVTTSVYPGAALTYTEKTDKVDLVQAAHMNQVQADAKAIADELGLDPAGSVVDVKTRLAVNLADDGGLQGGSAFPGSPISRQLFFRNDLESLYIRNNADDAWLVLGGSLSNLLFHYSAVTNNSREVTGTSLVPTTGGNYRFLRSNATVYETVLDGKYTHLSGVSTLTVYAQVWNDQAGGSPSFSFKADVGGQNNEATYTSGDVTPTWRNFTIDVSSLSVGTVYDVVLQLKKAGATTNHVYLGIVMMFGS